MKNSVDSNEDDALSIGCGIVQIDSAFSLIKNFKFIPTTLSNIKIQVNYNNDSNNYRGIYIREKYQSLQPIDLTVSVTPEFVKHSGKFK